MPYDPIEEYNDFANDLDDEFDEFAQLDFNNDAFLQEIAKAEEGALAVQNPFAVNTRRPNGNIHQPSFEQPRQQVPFAASSSTRGTNVGRGRVRATSNISGSRQTTLFESFGGSQSQGGNLTVTGGGGGMLGLRMVHEAGGTEGPPVPPDARCAHRFDPDAVRSWIYPMNYPVRDYQFTIVKAALFNNTLVSIPTGLGKTLIAAVVMYNFHRWFPNGKVVFMAPTKPLVAQQIKACHKICGISQNDTVQLTGQQNAESRRTSWLTKRVFFLTPQIMKNDLQKGTCPASQVVCVVVDEAHRATGNYAYCEVVRELANRNAQYRLLALTATPGTTVEAIQMVIDNLLISKIESRTESSPDILPYTHQTVREPIIVPLGPILTPLCNMVAKIMSGYATRLYHQGVIRDADPYKLSNFGIMQGRAAYRLYAQNKGIPQGQKAAAECDGAILSALCQAFTLLLHHGLRPFQSSLSQYIHGFDGTNMSHSKKELVGNPDLQNVLNTAASLIADPEFSGHPKLDRLVAIILDHFSRLDPTDDVEPPGADPKPQTRVMIFSQFRESVEDIVHVLNKHDPIIRAMTFLGQAAGKSGKGLSQKEQLEVISKFQAGNYNVLVSTSIGEEGLDIGDVDLIVCYDSQSSPIRMLQRMGRTGRKRQGRVAFLLTEGREHNAWEKSQNTYKTLQKSLTDSRAFQLCEDSPTVLPTEAKPGCIKKVLEIADYEIVEKVRKSRSGKRVVTTGADDEEATGVGNFLERENLDAFVRKYTTTRVGSSKTRGKKRKQPVKKRTLPVPDSDDEDGNDFDMETFLDPSRSRPDIDIESDESDESEIGDSPNAVVNRTLRRPIAGIGIDETGYESEKELEPPHFAMELDDDGLIGVNDIEAALMGVSKSNSKTSKKRKEAADDPSRKKSKKRLVERRMEDWPDESEFIRIRDTSPGYNVEMGELDDGGMFQYGNLDVQEEREILSVIDEVEFEEFPAFEADIDSLDVDMCDPETIPCNETSTVSLDYRLPDQHDNLIAKKSSPNGLSQNAHPNVVKTQPVVDSAPILKSAPSASTSTDRLNKDSPRSRPSRLFFGTRIPPVPPQFPKNLVLGNLGQIGPDDSVLGCHNEILEKLANARTGLAVHRRRGDYRNEERNGIDIGIPKIVQHEIDPVWLDDHADSLAEKPSVDIPATKPTNVAVPEIETTTEIVVPIDVTDPFTDHVSDDDHGCAHVWDEPEMSPEDGNVFEFDMSFDAEPEMEEIVHHTELNRGQEIGTRSDEVRDLLDGIQFEEDEEIEEWDLDALEDDQEDSREISEKTDCGVRGTIQFDRTGETKIEIRDGVSSVLRTSNSGSQRHRIDDGFEGTVPVRHDEFRDTIPAHNFQVPVTYTAAGPSPTICRKMQKSQPGFMENEESTMSTQMPRRGRRRVPIGTINLVSPSSKVTSPMKLSVIDPPRQQPRNRLRKGKSTDDRAPSHENSNGGAVPGSRQTTRNPPQIPGRSKRERIAQPNPFLELEAQLSDEGVEYSGDEMDPNMDENLSGFIDDGTQPDLSSTSIPSNPLNSSSPAPNMHAFYRQSLLSPADANRAFQQSANRFGGARFKMKFGVGTPGTPEQGNYDEYDEDDDGFVVDDDASLTVDDDSQESVPGRNRTDDQVLLDFEKIGTPPPITFRTTRNRFILPSSSPVSVTPDSKNRKRINDTFVHSSSSPFTSTTRPPEMDGVFKKPTPKSKR